MSIGVNWKEIWADVWGSVWRQATVAAATEDERAPRRGRARLTLYRKPPAPKKPRQIKKAKKLKARQAKKQGPVVTPKPVISPLQTYAANVPPMPAAEVTLNATLEGCSFKATGKLDNYGRIRATLEGASFEASLRLGFHDDAIGLAMGLPEMEPELIET